MVSSHLFEANTQPFKANLDKIIPIALLTIGWILFVLSAMSYQNVSWFYWLIGSRIAAVVIGFLLVATLALKPIKLKNVETLYFMLCLAIQSSHGILEGASQKEFYSFTGVCFLLLALGYKGSLSDWHKKYLPIALGFVLMPLLTKDRALTLPLGHFVDNFSWVVVGIIFGLVVAKSNATKHDALLNNILLKEKMLELEKNSKALIAAELDAAKIKMRNDAKKSALGDIAGQVAHDIRSPLAALDSVMTGLATLPESQRLLVRTAINRIKDIANNLLEKNREITAMASGAITTITTGAEPLSNNLISSLIEMLITEKRMQYRSKIEIQIDARLDSSSYGLFASIQPSEFKRVISNLCNNSIEAVGDRGAVTVALLDAGKHVEIQIGDSGKGIPPELLAKLGQRGVSHGKTGGNGLGLYHARTSVETWGGTLEIESEIDKGTLVKISLPKAAPPAWFVSELCLLPNSVVAVLDDDSSIHGVWDQRFNDLDLMSNGIEVVHFSTPQEIENWVHQIPRSRETLFLADYELLGYQQTGLDVIKQLNIAAQSVLVTSRFEEKGVADQCDRLNLRRIPKGMASIVPIRIRQAVA